jgi:hypothetical protein
VSRVAKPSRSDVEDALYSADPEVRHCGMRWRLMRALSLEIPESEVEVDVEVEK